MTFSAAHDRAIHDRDWASATPTLGRKFPELSCLHRQSVGTPLQGLAALELLGVPLADFERPQVWGEMRIERQFRTC